MHVRCLKPSLKNVLALQTCLRYSCAMMIGSTSKFQVLDAFWGHLSCDEKKLKYGVGGLQQGSIASASMVLLAWLNQHVQPACSYYKCIPRTGICPSGAYSDTGNPPCLACPSGEVSDVGATYCSVEGMFGPIGNVFVGIALKTTEARVLPENNGVLLTEHVLTIETTSSTGV